MKRPLDKSSRLKSWRENSSLINLDSWRFRIFFFQKLLFKFVFNKYIYKMFPPFFFFLMLSLSVTWSLPQTQKTLELKYSVKSIWLGLQETNLLRLNPKSYPGWKILLSTGSDIVGGWKTGSKPSMVVRFLPVNKDYSKSTISRKILQGVIIFRKQHKSLGKYHTMNDRNWFINIRISREAKLHWSTT